MFNDMILPVRSELTFDVSEVSPAEFSLVFRPLCGPGFGFCPFAKASRTFFVVAGVRSSCTQFSPRHARSRKTTNIKIVVHNHHRCITASTLALNFNDGEFTVTCRGSWCYSTQLTANRAQNLRGTPQHAWCGGTNLHEVLPDWFTAPIQ
jgi:hypothetical protein